MAGRNSDQQPQSPPKRVEIRVDGRVRFANDCYDSTLDVEDDVVKFTAALHPTLVDVAAAPKRPPEKFGDDPREGEEVIQKVHTGSRKPPAPKEST